LEPSLRSKEIGSSFKPFMPVTLMAALLNSSYILFLSSAVKVD
jgi:hypothetical protein